MYKRYTVEEYFLGTFHRRVIREGHDIERPAQSLDFSPCDFFLKAIYMAFKMFFSSIFIKREKYVCLFIFLNSFYFSIVTCFYVK